MTAMTDPRPIDAEASAAQPVPPTRRPSRPAGRAMLGWVVAAVAVVVAAVFAFLWAGLQNEATDREQVRRAAERLVLQVTTFNGAEIEQWVAALQERSTGAYAQQVNELFDQGLRDELRAREAVSVGELQRLFVQQLEGDEAEVFAVVRQTIANNALDNPVQDELRMDITMRRVDGRWLASRVAVLAPTGLPGAPGPEQGSPP
jgi:Mce-associated membrane protein